MRDAGDWLKVVFGRELEASAAPRRPARAEICVRQAPSPVNLGGAREDEQRVRVTVVPSEPGQEWRLYLRDFGPGPGEAAAGHVWWRMDPGTWQPLSGTRQCVAEGRGRIRLDVWLRGGPAVAGASRTQLKFVAEAGRGRE